MQKELLNCLLNDSITLLAQNALIYHVPSIETAKTLVNSYYEDIAAIARKFNYRKAIIRTGSKQFEILSGEPKIMGRVAIAASVYPLDMLRKINEFARDDSKKWSVVAVESDRQIMVSESLAPQIIGASIQDAVRRTRADYMPFEDLMYLKRDCNRLSVGQELYTHYRIFSPVTGKNWRVHHVNIRLYESEGFFYHLVESLETTPIA